MIEALLLICGLGVGPEACTERTAVDAIRVKVEATLCALQTESIVAGMPGSQLDGRVMKLICGRKA